MSTRSTTKISSGSASRSSPGIYNKDPATMFSVKPSVKTPSAKTVTASANYVTANTPVSSSKTRLLTVPVMTAASATGASTGSDAGGSSFLRYVFIIIILGFLGLTLFLYLEKPVDKSLKNLYDPVLKYLGMDITDKDKQNAGVQKLEKALNEKKVINKIDKDKADDDTDDDTNKKEATSQSEVEEQASNLLKRKYKKKPVVIPTPDEASTNSLHTNKPKSKAGFCYIGEDTGIRSCIKVGEGDVCMSGDIFPTQAICINPNLRE